MAFSDTLRGYLDALDVSAQDFAHTAQLSPSAISRYLSGTRVPSAQGDTLPRLAAAIATMGNGTYDQARVLHELMLEVSGSDLSQEAFTQNFRTLMDSLDISGNRLAHALGFDPSYISRIRQGQRFPANISTFIERVSRYVAQSYTGSAQLSALSNLLDVPTSRIEDVEDRAHLVATFLGSTPAETPGADTRENSVGVLLAKLDDFDLNDFLANIHFDEIRVPTAPFQLPTTKTYEGIEQMKQAELDYLRAAVLSRSMEDVILYSDMPLGEMAQDEDFAKKIMMGMALLIRKGLHLHNIHDVHRPISELIMGLEGWIPVYMTGQMSPYYLEEPTNNAFLHFLRSAGSVAVSGEAIRGDQASGRYVVSKNAGDVAYYRRRAQQLLARAKPLMRIYREDELDRLERDLAALVNKAPGTDAAPIRVGEGTFKSIRISVWPNSHALIEKSNAPKVNFLVEYPALVDALERYTPALF